MAANHASIKLSTAFIDEARKEAEVLHRSVGAQVEHWAKLGRAFENAPGVGIDRVREALKGGRLKIEDLTAEEQDQFFGRLGEYFARPNPRVETYYAELGAQEGAVGTDENGHIVRRSADGSLQRIR
jgi:ParD-like antitoxin of type II ParDE toxin-antitoxin system